MPTDKSGKFSVMSMNTYEAMGQKQIAGDREIDEAEIVRINNAYPFFEWKAYIYIYIYIYYYTQLVAANWRIDLDTWIFVKTFKVSLLASQSLVLAGSNHI